MPLGKRPRPRKVGRRGPGLPTVSRSHAALLRDHKGNWTLQPLQTKNGTRVNGKK
ncbi:MAG: FHA domain-containing protein [Evtepia sp.]